MLFKNFDGLVWSPESIEVAHSLIDLGFTEFGLNYKGNVLAKMEIPVLNEVVLVVVSWLDLESSLSIRISGSGRLVYSDTNREFAKLESRHDAICFIDDIVGGYMYELVIGEQK